ncbi:MAG: hypothetical protein ACHQJ4_07280 [Ignavibacteria bacterium]
MKESIIKYLVLFSFLVSFAGCFDVKREIKLYPNGGGEEKIHITLDKEFFEVLNTYASQDQTGKAKEKLAIVSVNENFQPKIYGELLKTGNTSVQDCTITDKPDGSKEIYIDYTFDEPNAIIRVVGSLTNWFANNPEVVYSGSKFTDESGVIKYKNFYKNASRAFNDDLANSLFQSLMMSHRVEETINFPFHVTATNANSQSENSCTWSFSINDAMFNSVELTAEMDKPGDIDLPYAEKIEKIVKVDQKSNPLIRVMVYNANKEWVKTITGIVIKDDELVTSFKLMDLIEGQGYFSVRLNNDSLAGIDEMHEGDLDQSMDLCFLRFGNFEKVKPLKYAPIEVTPGASVKIMYHPNTLSSVVYIMDATMVGTQKMSGNYIYEIKPKKPISLEGGAVFNDNGEFMGMITTAFNGEVGKLYVVPGLYIKTRIPKD